MAADTGQERTEQATPKRLREAREKGQVPRSRELNSMTLLVASAAWLLMMGDQMLESMQQLLQQGLSIKPSLLKDDHGIIISLVDAGMHSLIALAPMLLVLMIITALTPLGLGGWQFSAKAMSFKVDKLDPIKGFGRMFSARGLMELFKVLAKFVLVAAISTLIIWSLFDELLGLSLQPLEPALERTASICAWAFLGSSSVLIIIAAIDVPFQLWQHNKQLRMTHQEVKDEHKETEGRPEVKSRIRSRQQELSQRRMMEAVPEADVVITNPTHYAVALRYDQDNMLAPRVVAKGADLLAARIRSVANSHNVTIVEAPPLARALYATTDIDREIPATLYVAVANILSYVYQLKAVHGTAELPPDLPDDLPVPDEYL